MKQQKFIVSRPGGRKSDIEVAVGVHAPSESPRGSVAFFAFRLRLWCLQAFFSFLGLLDASRWSRGCLLPGCLRIDFPLCPDFLPKFPLSVKTPFTLDQGPHQWPLWNLISFVKALDPNNFMFWGTGVVDFNLSLQRHKSIHYSVFT